MDADEAFAIWYAPKIKFFLGRTIERSHHKAFKAAPGAADFEDLQLVDEWLKDNQLQLVKKTGIGVRIDGPHSQKLRILENVRKRNKSVVEHSPAARKTFIGMQLAAYDNCRIYELSEQLYVSRATIHKDLLALSNDMNIYDITLHRNPGGSRNRYKGCHGVS